MFGNRNGHFANLTTSKVLAKGSSVWGDDLAASERAYPPQRRNNSGVPARAIYHVDATLQLNSAWNSPTIQGGNLSGPTALPASFSGVIAVCTLFL